MSSNNPAQPADDSSPRAPKDRAPPLLFAIEAFLLAATVIAYFAMLHAVPGN